jgi:hypothetical protein
MNSSAEHNQPAFSEPRVKTQSWTRLEIFVARCMRETDWEYNRNYAYCQGVSTK